jgi:hypothetical protein
MTSPLPTATRATAATVTADEDPVTALVDEIRHLRARLESLETILAHAVIPAVATHDHHLHGRNRPDPITGSRGRLTRRPVLTPLADPAPVGPRPPGPARPA